MGGHGTEDCFWRFPLPCSPCSNSNQKKEAETVLTFGSSSNWRLVRREGSLRAKVSPLVLPSAGPVKTNQSAFNNFMSWVSNQEPLHAHLTVSATHYWLQKRPCENAIERAQPPTHRKEKALFLGMWQDKACGVYLYFWNTRTSKANWVCTLYTECTEYPYGLEDQRKNNTWGKNNHHSRNKPHISGRTVYQVG